MTAKEYLSQLRLFDLAINQKIRELSDLQAKTTAIGSFDYSKDRVQTSPSSDASYVKAVDRIADLDAEINREIDRFVEKKHEIIGRIQQLEDPRFADLLFKRYVEYKPFDTIAGEMGYAYRYVIQLHSEALRDFETTYPILQQLTQSYIQV